MRIEDPLLACTMCKTGKTHIKTPTRTTHIKTGWAAPSHGTHAQFAGFGGNIKLPVQEMIQKLVVTVLVPLALGKVVPAALAVLFPRARVRARWLRGVRLRVCGWASGGAWRCGHGSMHVMVCVM